MLRHGTAILAEKSPGFLNDYITGLTSGEIQSVDAARLCRSVRKDDSSQGSGLTRKEEASFLAEQISRWKAACSEDPEVQVGDQIISAVRQEHGEGVAVDTVLREQEDHVSLGSLRHLEHVVMSCWRTFPFTGMTKCRGMVVISPSEAHKKIIKNVSAHRPTP